MSNPFRKQGLSKFSSSSIIRRWQEQCNLSMMQFCIQSCIELFWNSLLVNLFIFCLTPCTIFHQLFSWELINLVWNHSMKWILQNTIHINICDSLKYVVAKFVGNLLLDLQFLNCQLSNLQLSTQQFCHAFIDGVRSSSFIKLLQGMKKLCRKNQSFGFINLQHEEISLNVTHLWRQNCSAKLGAMDMSKLF